MNARRPRTLVLLVGLALAGALIASASAGAARQPAGPGDDRPPPPPPSGEMRGQMSDPARPPRADAAPPGPGPAISPEEMRARITRRLEDTRRLQTRLERALAELDSGADTTDVARALLRDGGDRPLRMGPEGAPPPPAGERPSPEERQRMLAFAREHFPNMTERLDRFRERDPAVADRMLERMAPRLQEMMDLRERDAALFDLRVEEMRADWGLGEAVRAHRFSADGPARTGALAALREAVARQVRAQVAVQAHELEMLTARLERLRTDLAARREGLDAEIDRRTTELQNAPARLGPEGGPARRPGRPGAGANPGPRTSGNEPGAPAPR